MVGIGSVRVKRKGVMHSSDLNTVNLESKTFGHLKIWIWTLGERFCLESSAYWGQGA